MPTVLRVGPYRFYFFASDRVEPPHIHVRREKLVAKFWLDPVRVARSGRFSGHELNTIEQIVRENEQLIREVWNDAFGT